MITWEDYKNHLKTISEEECKNIEEIEEMATILSSIIKDRTKY